MASPTQDLLARCGGVLRQQNGHLWKEAGSNSKTSNMTVQLVRNELDGGKAYDLEAEFAVARSSASPGPGGR